MKIVKTIAEVRAAVKAWRAEGLSVGLVPTMGFLHEGHKSLIDRAVKENDRVVVSDFVNPTQFGPTEDLASYPRDLERDAALCENAGAALLFNPEPSEMYAEDACTFVDMSGLTGELCGKSRPIHWRLHRCFQAVPHRSTRPCLFRTKGCTAAFCYSPHGA